MGWAELLVVGWFLVLLGNCLGTGACALFIICLCQPLLVYALGPELRLGLPADVEGGSEAERTCGEDAEAKKG